MIRFAVAFLVLISGRAVQAGDLSVDGELSSVWQSRNVVEIPEGSATRFSLTQFGYGPAFAGRIYVNYAFDDRHEVRALWAPLSLRFEGPLDGDVSFQETQFTDGVATRALYRFNSYRATYRYVFHRSKQWILRAGVSIKVRDAEISLEQNGLEAFRANVGFVPLLHFNATYQFEDRMRAILDIEALAAPQGRAEDIALIVERQMTPRVRLRTGYRMVEGGSSGGGGVFSFAWLHYAVFGVGYDFE